MKGGFISADDFDRIVDPKKMVRNPRRDLKLASEYRSNFTYFLFLFIQTFGIVNSSEEGYIYRSTLAEKNFHSPKTLQSML